MEKEKTETGEFCQIGVEGMTCSNCAKTVENALKKLPLEDIRVDFVSKEARFKNPSHIPLSEIKKAIEKAGYKVIIEENQSASNKKRYSPLFLKLVFSAIFTFPLLLHMFVPASHWLNNIWLQFFLATPVYIIGVMHFGKGAYHALKMRNTNMDVLIIIGASAAYFYSLYGALFYPHEHRFLFFETAASIISIVLLGSYIEEISVNKTTQSIEELKNIQPQYGKKVEITTDGKIEIHQIDVKDFKKGDVFLAAQGDVIPLDGVVSEGEAWVNEAMITGESEPVYKTVNDKIIGGTIVEKGNLKGIVESTENETVLNRIINLVKQAQSDKPHIQRLGDKVSSIFVPVVVFIAITTFIVWNFILNAPVEEAMLNAIAVLVISCPCAMGLAIPTAVVVGLGLAAKRGILIKGASTIEEFANIETIVFDKTGTLTTGNFTIRKIDYLNNNRQLIYNIIYSLEQHSSHPIAQSIINLLKNKAEILPLKQLQEIPGEGISAYYENDKWYLGKSKTGTTEIELYKNNELMAKIEIYDEIKKDAKKVIQYLKSKNIEVVLLSGDNQRKCEMLAQQLEIDKIYFDKKPDEKFTIIEQLVKTKKTAMVGDGINDAPALEKAHVSVSFSDATQVAINSAKIILLQKDSLVGLQQAHNIALKTYQTTKQNLFWAFFYNVLAIPIAAAGFLSPIIAAFSMGFSDVIVVGNSLLLKWKKID
jgi:Cu+-exporting ATPase